MIYDVLVIGGGAAGFYTAIHVAGANPSKKIVILERGKEVLTKVRVSGGGRCNVTHAAFEPKELSRHYPRGEKELLGPFHKYACGDTVGFFEDRGVPLKIEEDGRIFPKTDSSQTIIDCFLSETNRLGIEVHKLCVVIGLEKIETDENLLWSVQTHKATFKAEKIVVATGSNTKIWNLLEQLGHTIISPVPSLFTFNIADNRITDIPGVSTHVQVEVLPKKGMKNRPGKESILKSEGPLLITHWGMSGPAILKLSAWGARILESYQYRFKIKVNWIPEYHANGLLEYLLQVKQIEKKTILRTKLLDIPKRLWMNLVKASGIEDTVTWPEISKHQLRTLSEQLTACVFYVNGKSTFKEEFVTAGGVDLKEIDFKTYESKLLSGLYFAGEVINVDAITGGFNFQNAWTAGYTVATAITSSYKKDNL